MIDHEAIEKVYETAEFWGYPIDYASRYVEENLNQFRLKSKKLTIKGKIIVGVEQS